MDHLACVRTAADVFAEGARAYVRDGEWAEAVQLAAQTRRAEAHADDVRRNVLGALVAGALLPPSRRQVLELTERVDGLANACERALDFLVEQRVEITEQVRQPLLGILEVTESVFDHVESALRALFSGDSEATMEHIRRIEKAESAVDRLEREVVKQLFHSDIGLAHKLHNLGAIQVFAQISDLAEDLSDRLALIVAEGVF
jgi:predicted phosphate transport protein (TIGR00153 family)